MAADNNVKEIFVTNYHKITKKHDEFVVILKLTLFTIQICLITVVSTNYRTEIIKIINFYQNFDR